MKRLLTLFTVLTLLGSSGAFAVKVSNYTETFSRTLNTSDHAFAPRGWSHIVDSYQQFNWSSVNYVSYKQMASGGHDDGAYLRVGSQTLISYQAKDLLVTPELRGEVKFWVRKPSASTVSSLTVYDVLYDEDADTYTVGTTHDVEVELTDEWQQVTISDISGRDNYLGFRLHNLDFDDFYCATAAPLLVNELTIQSVSATGGTAIDAAADGSFTLAVEATLKNTGDFLLSSESDEYSYTLTLTDRATGEEIATAPITEEMDLDATTVQTVTATLNVAQLTDGTIAVDVRENVNDPATTAAGPTFTVTPYAPIPVLTEQGKSAELADGAVEYFGVTTEAVERSFTLKNNGAAGMTVGAILPPEGYELATDLSFPLSVEAHGQIDYTVRMMDGEAGERVGKLTVEVDGAEPATLWLHGAILGSEGWHEGFEQGSVPGNFVTTWGVANVPAQYGLTGNGKWLMNGAAAVARVITPPIMVGEGDAVSFSAAIRNTNSKGLSIYASADRKEWTLLRTLAIGADDEADRLATDMVASNYGVLKRFTLTGLPQGRTYLAFDGSAMYLDDFTGPALAELNHDFYFETVTVPATATVNHDVAMKVKVRNATTATEPAEGYTLTLLVGGEAVAQAESIDLEPGQQREFSFSYTPHRDGELPVRFEITTADGEVFAEEAQMEVSPETADGEVATLSGRATFEADGEAASGVEVRLSSGNVLYEATTGADGTYSIAVYQDQLDYQLTATLTGFMPIVRSVQLKEGSAEVNLVMAVADRVAITATSLPTEGTVNEPLAATARLTNPTTESIADYTATLLLDGKAVATAQAIPLGPGEEATIGFDFYPHQAGELPICVAVVTDGKEVRSEAGTITIAAEEGNKTVQVGTNSVRNTTAFPFGYNSTEGIYQCYYTPEQLGLDKGTKIKAVTLRGYTYSTFTMGNKLYLQNATEGTLAANGENPSEAMQLVWQGEKSISRGGSGNSTVDIVTFTLDEPFVYDGGYLIMALESVASTAASLYVEMDKDKKQGQSTQSLTNITWTKNQYAAVAYLTVDDVLTATGSVTDRDSQQPVGGAEVRLVSGGVEYSGVTDDAGLYSIDVVQKDLDYAAVVAAPTYILYKESGITLGENDFQLMHNVTFNAARPSTVVLPVALSAAEVSAAGTFYRLTGYDDATRTLTFQSVGQTVADEPYLFFPNESEPFDFTQFDISQAEAGETAAGEALFCGTYERLHLVSDSETSYYGYRSSDNEYLRVGTEGGAWCGQFHAYIALPAADADAARISISLDGMATGIENIEHYSIEHPALNIDHCIYDLQGRRVAKCSMPNVQCSMENGQLSKGIYIVNGKKIVR